jgi:hypothetical protein
MIFLNDICHDPSLFMYFKLIYGILIESTFHWYLIFGRQKNLIFPFFVVSGTFWLPKNQRKKIHDQFFIKRKTMGRRSTRGEPRGPNEARWRAPSAGSAT